MSAKDTKKCSQAEILEPRENTTQKCGISGVFFDIFRGQAISVLCSRLGRSHIHEALDATLQGHSVIILCFKNSFFWGGNHQPIFSNIFFSKIGYIFKSNVPLLSLIFENVFMLAKTL